ncbi:MAG TPA: hypothetical protein VIT88_08340 [Pyrinomonadaceae bacterium]
MYGLIKIMRLIKYEGRTRGLAAVAMAALIFFSALPMKARAQNTYGGATVVHAGSIGLVPGQRVSVAVPNFYFLDGSVKFVKHSIKVYTETQSNLVYSGESGQLEHEVGHIFTFRHEHLSVPGESSTGRVQVWIEIESFPPSETEKLPADRSSIVSPPTFELIDELSGRTVLSNAAGRSVSISLRARPELTATANESK